MKDGLCMFGSKYLNLPDNIFIDTFKNGELWDGKKGEILYNIDTETEALYKEFCNTKVIYYLFIKKRLKRYFRELLTDVFVKYINKDYSFGNKGTIDDDIDEYVEKNILNLYEIDKVYMYVKGDKVGINDRLIENEYYKYLDKENNLKIKSGFPIINDNGKYVLENSKISRIEKSNINEFDRCIHYYLKTGFRETFGFAVSIKRR
jgi:hypothetical protein